MCVGSGPHVGGVVFMGGGVVDMWEEWSSCGRSG